MRGSKSSPPPIRTTPHFWNVQIYFLFLDEDPVETEWARLGSFLVFVESFEVLQDICQTDVFCRME